jgi:hypothetical protein
LIFKILCLYLQKFNNMTLKEIAQRILLQQGQKTEEKHLSDCITKYKIAINNTQRIEAITELEIEIEKIKDSMDLAGYRRSDQFEARYFHLKKIAKELRII